MQHAHRIWLEDMAIRLLCVLALDRFGDFVSDAVVAPVRETCAQCLCAVLRLMDGVGCRGALRVLLQLLDHQVIDQVFAIFALIFGYFSGMGG